MKSATIKALGLCCAFSILAGFSNAQTVVEGFEDPSEWRAGGNDLVGGATVTSATVTADKTEGAGAMEITYNHSGRPYYEVYVAKTFDAPQDFSNYVQFDVDIKGNANVATDVVWFLSFKCANGQSIQMLHNINDTDYESPVENFKRWSFSLSEFRWGGYYTSTHLNQFDMARVTEVALYMQAKATVTAPAAAVMTLDNLVAHTTTGRQTVDVLERFDYADSSALQAAWQPSIATGDNTATAALGPDLDGTGGSLEVTFNAGHQYDRMGAIYQLPAPRDFSNVAAFQVILEGDAAMASSSSRYAGLVLEDGSGNEALWYFSSPLNKGKTTMYLANDLSSESPSIYWKSALHDYEWDGGTAPIDRTFITHLAVTFTDSNSAGYPHSFSLKVDEIKTITSNGLPKVSVIGDSNVADWTLY